MYVNWRIVIRANMPVLREMPIQIIKMSVVILEMLLVYVAMTRMSLYWRPSGQCNAWHQSQNQRK